MKRLLSLFARRRTPVPAIVDRLTHARDVAASLRSEGHAIDRVEVNHRRVTVHLAASPARVGLSKHPAVRCTHICTGAGRRYHTKQIVADLVTLQWTEEVSK